MVSQHALQLMGHESADRVPTKKHRKEREKCEHHSFFFCGWRMSSALTERNCAAWYCLLFIVICQTPSVQSVQSFLPSQVVASELMFSSKLLVLTLSRFHFLFISAFWYTHYRQNQWIIDWWIDWLTTITDIKLKLCFVMQLLLISVVVNKVIKNQTSTCEVVNRILTNMRFWLRKCKWWAASAMRSGVHKCVFASMEFLLGWT